MICYWRDALFLHLWHMNPLSLSCNLSWSSSSCGFTSSLSVIISSCHHLSAIAPCSFRLFRHSLKFFEIAAYLHGRKEDIEWWWEEVRVASGNVVIGFELELPARAPQLSVSDHVCSWKRLILMTRPVCNYWSPLVSVCLFINVFKVQLFGELSVCWWHVCSQFILFNANSSPVTILFKTNIVRFLRALSFSHTSSMTLPSWIFLLSAWIWTLNVF